MTVNPALITCTKDTWVKVATGVVIGAVHRFLTGPEYIQTYKLTGEAAPTLNTDGVALFKDSTQENISATDPIDVYVMAIGEDGKVRVDL